MIQVFLQNNRSFHAVEEGSSLLELAQAACPEVTDPKTRASYPVLAALVDHKLKELSFKIFYPHEITFIGYDHPDGRRTYFRSLSFLLQHAVRTVLPGRDLRMEHSLPSGMYCELRDGGPDGPAVKPAPEELAALKARMQELVDADLPFTTEKIRSEEAEIIFSAQRQPQKASLRRSLGHYFCRVYHLAGQTDTFHGPLVPSTGMLGVFDLMPFHEGFCLQYPSAGDITRTIPGAGRRSWPGRWKDMPSGAARRGSRASAP